MTSTTPKGYPYPVGTDLVSAGDNAIQALATAVDTKLPARSWVGTVVVPVTANTVATVGVTFPAGRFNAVPRIIGIVRSTSVWFPYVNSITATSAVIGVRTIGSALTGNIPVDLYAVQMLATDSDG